MKVIYPVLFYEEKEGGYSVFVPDLKNNSTCGSTLEEAMTMAEDLIAGIVLDEMEENNQIPKSSKIEDVSFEKLEKYLDIENWDYVSKFKTYISVDISSFAEKWGKELVKKISGSISCYGISINSPNVKAKSFIEEYHSILDKEDNLIIVIDDLERKSTKI